MQYSFNSRRFCFQFVRKAWFIPLTFNADSKFPLKIVIQLRHQGIFSILFSKSSSIYTVSPLLDLSMLLVHSSKDLAEDLNQLFSTYPFNIHLKCLLRRRIFTKNLVQMLEQNSSFASIKVSLAGERYFSQYIDANTVLLIILFDTFKTKTLNVFTKLYWGWKQLQLALTTILKPVN